MGAYQDETRVVRRVVPLQKSDSDLHWLHAWYSRPQLNMRIQRTVVTHTDRRVIPDGRTTDFRSCAYRLLVLAHLLVVTLCLDAKAPTVSCWLEPWHNLSHSSSQVGSLLKLCSLLALFQSFGFVDQI